MKKQIELFEQTGKIPVAELVSDGLQIGAFFAQLLSGTGWKKKQIAVNTDLQDQLDNERRRVDTLTEVVMGLQSTVAKLSSDKLHNQGNG